MSASRADSVIGAPEMAASASSRRAPICVSISAAAPVSVRISWQRAMMLLWQGKVEVVEEYDDRLVRSVTLEIRITNVVLAEYTWDEI